MWWKETSWKLLCRSLLSLYRGTGGGRMFIDSQHRLLDRNWLSTAVAGNYLPKVICSEMGSCQDFIAHCWTCRFSVSLLWAPPVCGLSTTIPLPWPIKLVFFTSPFHTAHMPDYQDKSKHWCSGVQQVSGPCSSLPPGPRVVFVFPPVALSRAWYLPSEFMYSVPACPFPSVKAFVPLSYVLL